MAWIPAVVGAVGGLAEGLIGSRGSSKANRTNIMLQREQQAWEERMANTAVQRRKDDLLAAGFNPMLSFTSGQAAETPNVRSATVENERASYVGAASRGVASAVAAAQLRLVDSQVSVQQAQARKTNAEAAITESDVPYSAESAGYRRDQLKSQVENLRASFDSIVEGTAKTMTEAEIARQMSTLTMEYQRLVNRGETLGMAERKALHDLYDSMKGAKGFERLMPIVLSIITAGSRR